MTVSMRSQLAHVRGLGAAREGVGHFIGQRASAAAMVLLLPWFLTGLAAAVGASYETAAAWVRAPVNAVLILILVGAGLQHMRLGLQIIIEDYLARPMTRHLLLLLVTLFAASLFLGTAYCVIKI